MKAATHGDSTYVISLFNQLEPEYKKNIVELMKGLVGVKNAAQKIEKSDIMKVVANSEAEFITQIYEPDSGGVKLGFGKGKKECPKDFHSNDAEMAMLFGEE